MAMPKQSPPHPQPGPDPRDTQGNRESDEPLDHAQSPHRANMDPLPPARVEDEMLHQEGAHVIESQGQGVTHRAGPVNQNPEASEQFFPPVKDDRKAKLSR